MNVVDSSGWVEVFTDGPNASTFETVLDKRNRLVVPTLTITEVMKVLTRAVGEDEALQAVGRMTTAVVAPLDQAIALRAASIGLETGLALADSIILATARVYGATLWTQDADFEGMEGVRFVAREAE